MRKFLLLLLFCVGCSSLIPFAPDAIDIGIAWVNGEAHKYYFSDAQNTEQAVRVVLKKMEFEITKDNKNDKGVLTLTANSKEQQKKKRDRNNDSFKIVVDPVRHNVTKVSIRVNIMGDHEYAELIYDQIDKQGGMKCFRETKELKTALECTE